MNRVWVQRTCKENLGVIELMTMPRGTEKMSSRKEGVKKLRVLLNLDSCPSTLKR